MWLLHLITVKLNWLPFIHKLIRFNWTLKPATKNTSLISNHEYLNWKQSTSRTTHNNTVSMWSIDIESFHDFILCRTTIYYKSNIHLYTVSTYFITFPLVHNKVTISIQLKFMENKNKKLYILSNQKPKIIKTNSCWLTDFVYNTFFSYTQKKFWLYKKTS